MEVEATKATTEGTQGGNCKAPARAPGQKSQAGCIDTEELAEKVAGSDLAAHVATEDMTRLAGQVAQLTDWERYILGMSAEGFSQDDIALMEFQPLDRVNVRRILKLLRGEPVSDPPGRPSRREPLESPQARHAGRRGS